MADSHEINFEPVDIQMEVGEDENILDAAFRQGIHLMARLPRGPLLCLQVLRARRRHSDGELLDLRV